MTILNIVIEGNASRNMARLATVLTPPSLALFLSETVDRYLISRISERFNSEGDDAVGKWAPLAPATQKIRASRGYGAAHPINVRTGELRRFVEGASNRLISEDPTGAMLSRPSRASGRVREKLAGAQQGEFPAPPRPVLGLSMTDMAFTMTALEAYIRAGVGV